MANKSKDPSEEQAHRPEQAQPHQPGRETMMQPAPRYDHEALKGSGRLEGRVAIITGGDSGIGRAVAVAFAREGADVVICYLEEEEDARETARLVETKGRRCHLHCGDIGQKSVCCEAVEAAVSVFGR